MRTILTGQLAGPSMFDIVTTLGKEKVVARLSHIDHFFVAA
jgi:glutamyl-tRNA synthetase